MQEHPSPSRSHKSISSMVISINQDPLEEDPFYGDPQISDSSVERQDHSSDKSRKRLPEKAPVQIVINNERQAKQNISIPRVNEEPKRKLDETMPKVREEPKQRMKESREEKQEGRNSPGKLQSELSIYSNIVWQKSRYNETDVCDICGNADPGEFDGIYICDLCHCTTHQSCYGGDLANRNFLNDLSDEWFCERCSFLMKRKLRYDSVKCRFCPELKGSLKTCQDENGKVFWNKDRTHFDVVLRDLKKERFNLLCFLCEVKSGACVQCDFEGCFVSFHVTCGQKNGLIPTHDQTTKYGSILKSVYYMEIYCRKHQKTRYPEEMQLEMMQIQSAFLREKQNFSYIFGGSQDQKGQNRKTEKLARSTKNTFKASIPQRKEIQELELERSSESEENYRPSPKNLKRKRPKRFKKISDFSSLSASDQMVSDHAIQLEPKQIQGKKKNIRDFFLERTSEEASLKSEEVHLKDLHKKQALAKKAKQKAEKGEGIYDKFAKLFNNIDKDKKKIRKNRSPKPSVKDDADSRKTSEEKKTNFQIITEPKFFSFQTNEPIYQNKPNYQGNEPTYKTNEFNYQINANEHKNQPRESNNFINQPKTSVGIAEIHGEELQNTTKQVQIQHNTLSEPNENLSLKSSSQGDDILFKFSMEPKPWGEKIVKRKASSGTSSQDSCSDFFKPFKKPKLANANQDGGVKLPLKTATERRDADSAVFLKDSEENSFEFEEKKENFKRTLQNSSLLSIIPENIEIEKQTKENFSKQAKTIFSLENGLEKEKKPTEAKSHEKPFNLSFHMTNQENLITKDVLKEKYNLHPPQETKETLPNQKTIESPGSEILQQKPITILIPQKKPQESSKKPKKLLSSPKSQISDKAPLLPLPQIREQKSTLEIIEESAAIIQKIQNPLKSSSEIIEEPALIIQKTQDHPKSPIEESKSQSQSEENFRILFDQPEIKPISPLQQLHAIEEKSQSSEEIKYLETHKPERNENVIKWEKIKRLMPPPDKNARKNKENFVFNNQNHIWGNVFSNIYRIEFESSKELVEKISEEFTGLKIIKKSH